MLLILSYVSLYSSFCSPFIPKLIRRITIAPSVSGDINATHGVHTHDMNVHHTYDIADDHSVGDLSCPLCGGTDCLEEISV